MNENTYDAIAIGSGHNALVKAAYLARAGWKVLVLEMGDRPGGWVRTEELTLPGFHHDVYASTIPLWLLSPAHQDLGAELSDRLINIVGQHLPNVPAAILERHIISPSELAKSNLNAGAGAITSVAKDITEYALWRPSHRTLLPNLYRVGAATWPGHGVGGASGYIVARQLLSDR